MPFEAFSADKIFPSPAPMSPATMTRSANILHISGQVSQDVSGKTIGIDDVAAQTNQVIDNIEALLAEKGGTLDDICKVTIFLTSREHLAAVMDVRRRRFTAPYPAASAIVVAALANPEWLVEIEAMAALA
ncbi:RidA family protein [Pseudochelatococcus sp. B33]